MEHGQFPGTDDRTGGRPLVQVEYVDDDGRKWAVKVPEGEEDKAHMGIPIGPPDLSELGLPIDIEVRLHNQLYSRGLFTLRDIRGRRQNEIFASLQSALKVDVSRVTSLFR